MKLTISLLLIFFTACNNNEHTQAPIKTGTLKYITDTILVLKEAKPDTLLRKKYFNKRFRDVTVERIEKHTFLIRGQGQIFEANFNWIVEDGQNELQKGFQMTDAGAPDWGNFNFVVNVQKKRENSTLTLILFESSPMDGSREYELPITLY